MPTGCENCEAPATMVVRYAGIEVERCDSCGYSLLDDGLYADAAIVGPLA